MAFSKLSLVFGLFCYLHLAQAQKSGKFLLLVEQNSQVDLINKFGQGLSGAEADNAGFTFEMLALKVDREDEENSLSSACNVAGSETFSAFIDLTWGGWEDMKMQAEKNGIPYVRLGKD